MVGLK